MNSDFNRADSALSPSPSPSPVLAPSREPQPPASPKYRICDRIFALAVFSVCLIFAYCFPVESYPLGTFLCLLSLFIVSLFYFRVRGIQITLGGKILPSVIFLLLLSMITGANSLIRVLVFLAGCALLLFWVGIACGICGDGLFDKGIFGQFFHQIILTPIEYLFAFFPAVFSSRSEGENSSKRRIGKNLLWVLLGLVIAVVPTAVVGSLLSYDAVFSKLISSLSPKFLFEWIGDRMGRLILSLVLTLPVFAVLFGSMRCREAGKIHRSGEGVHLFPCTLLCAAVTPVLLLYILFFVSQWDNYVKAFSHTLANGYIYSVYAREGFFELCGVSAINAVMLLLFCSLMKKTPLSESIRRIYASVISVFSLILIATAISKMILYIDIYGLTQKRVYASWLMLLLAAGFLTVLLAQFFRKLPVAPVLFFTGLFFALVICLPNVDGLIADYNVDAYLSGRVSVEVDLEQLRDLDTPALPALLRLREEWQKNPPVLRKQNSSGEYYDTVDSEKPKQLDSVIRNLNSELKDEHPKGIFSFNIPDALSRAAVEKYYPTK